MSSSSPCTSADRRLPALGLAGLLLAAQAGALAQSAQAPPEVRAVAPAMQQAGSARMTYLMLDIYQATLWVAPEFRTSSFERHPFALELSYLRSLDGQAIARRSLAEMRRAATLTEAQARAWLAAMLAAFPNVNAGDRITGVNLPGEGVAFLVNGKAGARIADPEFARLFFGIWLAPTTSEPSLRQALLAQAVP